MLTPVQASVAYSEMFRRDVIAPAVIAQRARMDARVWQCAEPVGFAKAAGAAFSTIDIGQEWGPAWSTAWFRIEAVVPASMAGLPVALRFSTDTEGTLHRGGLAVQGLDPNRETAPLWKSGAGQREVVYVEAACNHPFGAEGLAWDPPEVHRRWKSATPGRFLACELVVIDAEVERLEHVFGFAVGLLKEVPPESSRAAGLMAALRAATAAVNDQSVSQTAGRAAKILLAELGKSAAGRAPVGFAVGHAHIDTAWLWPLRETRRKCIRTFANVLGLMEKHAGFAFMCSQAQQYAFVEEDAPELFKQIAARVREGRWEPTGGMWIEPDCNCVSGESLIRQIVHGTRYFQERFGEEAAQRILYLPDTFGFPGQLPQIMRHCGLDTFITNKMIWNDTTLPAHTNFVWRGIDGTSVLAHFTPGHDYNNTNTPKELRHAEHNHRGRACVLSEGEPEAPGAAARFLHPYGFGDGGGGPTAGQILNINLAADADGLPRMRHGLAREFARALHADHEALEGSTSALPRWDGELYLELHRGTYTTQARIKQLNREHEDLLRVAEALLAGRPGAVKGAVCDERTRAALDEAWKLLLLNQFHDILPGSSIAWVYRDAEVQHARVKEIAEGVIAGAGLAWAGVVGGAPSAGERLVFNPASEAVDQGGEVAIAALGVGFAQAARKSAVVVERGEGGWVLRERGLRCIVDDLGRVTSLQLTDADGNATEFAGRGGGGMNQLMLYRDRPKMWDAWDIDQQHLDVGEAVETPAEVRVIEGGVEVRRAIGARSAMVQRITLESVLGAVRFATEVDWREDHRLLRALFGTGLHAGVGVWGTQFGWHERPTTQNTADERARFESPAAMWIALREPQRQVGLMAVSKYGFSCRGSTMGVSLLRSPTYPDPTADRGVHRFEYALRVSAGGSPAEITACAEKMQRPLMELGSASGATSGGGGGRARSWAPFEVRAGGGAAVSISAFKPAEAGGSKVVLRLNECAGSAGSVEIDWAIAVRGVSRGDGLERAIDGGSPLQHAQGRTTLEVRPFEVVTIIADRT